MIDALCGVASVRVVVTILVAAACCACLGPGSTDALVIANSSPWADSVATRPVGSVTTFASIVPCTKDGAISVTGITATKPQNGFAIDAWGARPNPMATGGDSVIDALEPLQELGFTLNSANVVNSCPLEAEYAQSLELGVQVRWSGKATAWTEGLTVTYRDQDGNRGSITLPGTLVLCGEGAPPKASQCP